MEILPSNNIIRETFDEQLLERKIEGAKESKEDEKLMEVCKEFESVFIYMMMKEMKKTIPDEDGLIPKSTGTKIFEDMYMEELSKEVVERDEGFGIAKMMYEQFKNGYVSW